VKAIVDGTSKIPIHTEPSRFRKAIYLIPKNHDGDHYEKNHGPYSKQFRHQILALVQQGWTPTEIALKYPPSKQTILRWIKEANIDNQELENDKTYKFEELERLRLENKRLRNERHILKKFVFWFILEDGAKSNEMLGK